MKGENNMENKEMFTVTAKIHGFLGKIIPEIEFSIPKQVLYGITARTIKKTIQREMRKYMTAPAPTTDSPAPDTDSDSPAPVE